MTLTQREHDVFCAAASGLTMVETADWLCISTSTVKEYQRQLRVKTRTRTTSAAVAVLQRDRLRLKVERPPLRLPAKRSERAERVFLDRCERARKQILQGADPYQALGLVLFPPERYAEAA